MKRPPAGTQVVIRQIDPYRIVARLEPVQEPLFEKVVDPLLFFDDRQKIVGPVPLPRRRRVYCVLRSPHVNKDSREHFEIRVHKRLVDIHFPSWLTLWNLENKVRYLPGVALKIEEE